MELTEDDPRPRGRAGDDERAAAASARGRGEPRRGPARAAHRSPAPRRHATGRPRARHRFPSSTGTSRPTGRRTHRSAQTVTWPLTSPVYRAAQLTGQRHGRLLRSSPRCPDSCWPIPESPRLTARARASRQDVAALRSAAPSVSDPSSPSVGTVQGRDQRRIRPGAAVRAATPARRRERHGERRRAMRQAPRIESSRNWSPPGTAHGEHLQRALGRRRVGHVRR